MVLATSSGVLFITKLNARFAPRSRENCRRLNSSALSVTTEAELRDRLPGRYLAVGTTVLYGSYAGNPKEEELKESLRQHRPAARTSTFLIYDLKPELAGAPSHVGN